MSMSGCGYTAQMSDNKGDLEPIYRSLCRVGHERYTSSELRNRNQTETILSEEGLKFLNPRIGEGAFKVDVHFLNRYTARTAI